MANGPINSLTSNGIIAIVTNGFLDMGYLVSEATTPYPKTDYSTTPPTTEIIDHRGQNNTAGNTLITLRFPTPVTKFSITVRMTTYDGSAVIIYDALGTILKQFPIAGSHDVVFDPKPTSIEYVAEEGALIGRVDLRPSSRPDYIQYTEWSWGDPLPPPPQPSRPATTPRPPSTGQGTQPPTTGAAGPSTPSTPSIPQQSVPVGKSNIVGDGGSEGVPFALPDSFDSAPLSAYIEEEIYAAINAEYGDNQGIHPKTLRIMSKAIARAIKKYLSLHVTTYQRVVDVIPAGLLGQAGTVPVVINPNPHDHATRPHAHRINAP